MALYMHDILACMNRERSMLPYRCPVRRLRFDSTCFYVLYCIIFFDASLTQPRALWFISHHPTLLIAFIIKGTSGSRVFHVSTKQHSYALSEQLNVRKHYVIR